MAEIIANNTVTVTAGSASRTITGVFGSSSYMVATKPSWATAYSVRDKTSTQFVVHLGTPPLVDSDLDYTVIQLS